MDNLKAIAKARNGTSRRSWYVLRVESQREQEACKLLPLMDVAAFVPIEQRARKVRGKGGVALTSHPLLTGYVVAGFLGRPNWLQVFQWSMVWAVVSSDGHPMELTQNDVQSLFRIDQAASLPGAKSLQVGDDIKYSRNGFDQHAKLLDIQGVNCSFIINLLGKEHKVTRPIHEIEAA